MELTHRMELDFSGIGMRLDGLSPALESELGRVWGAFVTSAAEAPLLHCRFQALDRKAPPGRFRPKAMHSELDGLGAVFEMPEGRATVAADGTARIDLLGDLGRREYWTAVNLLRACLAWWLPQRGAALLHAAGLVVDGRAYLLVGPAGSGKSSWARLGEQGGARVLSDDLVLVDGSGTAVEALGAPFRSTHNADFLPGRWPVAAILFPHRGDAPARWTRAAPLVARGRILANLPFVADSPDTDGRLAQIVELLATGVPCLDLTFALDLSFLALLRQDG